MNPAQNGLVDEAREWRWPSARWIAERVGPIVNDESLRHLTQLQNLQRLNLYHTFVTEAGVENLRKALPECEVIWDRNSGLPTRRGS